MTKWTLPITALAVALMVGCAAQPTVFRVHSETLEPHTDEVATDAVATDEVITDEVITDAVATDAVATDAVATDAVTTDAVAETEDTVVVLSVMERLRALRAAMSTTVVEANNVTVMTAADGDATDEDTDADVTDEDTDADVTDEDTDADVTDEDTDADVTDEDTDADVTDEDTPLDASVQKTIDMLAALQALVDKPVAEPVATDDAEVRVYILNEDDTTDIAQIYQLLPWSSSSNAPKGHWELVYSYEDNDIETTGWLSLTPEKANELMAVLEIEDLAGAYDKRISVARIADVLGIDVDDVPTPWTSNERYQAKN
jgi:hypothetical protein